MLKACKKCRREGEKLILKGERCLSVKCAMTKRAYAPGQHGQGSFKKISEYGKQLREKQKARRLYGIDEGQFRNIVEKAEKITGNSAENLIKLLEMRIDNLVYRLGFTNSRSTARQIISHGHIKLNGKKINTPSITVKVGDVVEAYKDKMFSEVKIGNVSWAEIDSKVNKAIVKHIPSREEIDSPINENIIIEFYSR